MLAFRRMDKRKCHVLVTPPFKIMPTRQHDGKDAVKDRQDLQEIGHGGDEPRGRGVDDENGDGQPQSERFDGFVREVTSSNWGT